MRIAQEVTTLEAGGALSVRRSTMKTTRKTFRMNIDAIYSDKIGAAVRELPANAFDSHRRAKQSRPFYVHCPTLIDPRFWVRDFGVGMSDDTMGDTYIVVGESDKEDTNDEVGMWGLGSKSPFAYTDQYNITCFDGETARHYGYGIAEDGVPALYLMHQEPCSDPQGVQVSYAVESRDFDAFKRAIEKVALAYDPGSFESNITLPNLGELLLRGEGWCAFDDEGKRLTGSRWYARQGCVLYPITSQEVKRPSDYNTKATYILDCPIGTIRITPSRESIEYTSEVIDYLNARIERVQEETIEAIDEATKDIVSVVEFFKVVTKLKPSYINHNFTHPATGLTSAVLPATFPLTFFEPKFEHERWEFAAPGTLALESISKRSAIYLVDDISPLYDPSRAEHIGGLSRSEIRRISRFTRAFLEKKDQRSALFIFNTDWTPEFREACFGTTPLTDLKFSELKDAVPTRVAPPRAEMKPPIRGLALAKGAGEQKPVFEIDPAQKGVAWVSSEQYRRQSANLFRLAKRFDITALYIAAPPVQEKMAMHEISHLRAVVRDALAERDLVFADWYYAKEKLSGYEVKGFIEFLGVIERADPKAYDKLAAGEGEFSTIAKAVRRLLPAIDVLGLSDEEKKAIDTLLIDDASSAPTLPEAPPEMDGYERAIATIQRGYSNPTCKWVKDCQGLRNPDHAVKAVKVILQMQKLFPPSEKFA